MRIRTHMSLPVISAPRKKAKSMPSKYARFVRTLAGMGLMAFTCVAEVAIASSNVPEGFAHATTGGARGEVVTVSTTDQLKHELCHELNAAGLCGDNTPRTIVIDRTIDFRGEEGTASGLGCYPYPNKAEALVLLNSRDTHCNGHKESQIAYDKVGGKPLLVGSNKTVIGVGAAGVIEGRGLRLVNVNNVIIRNLTITEINPSVIFAGDAITLSGVDNVWIDHNRFYMIGRQMIAAGFDSVTHVTVSWNDFDGRSPYAAFGNSDHYWNMLFETGANSVQSVTIANNWVHNFAGRAPIITGNGVFQIVNNYFQNGCWHALNAFNGMNVLVEGNYYDQVSVPILKNSNLTQVGSVFGLLDGKSNASAQQLCAKELGRKCGTNIAVGASDLSGFDQNEQVLSAVKAMLPLKSVKSYEASNVPSVVQAQAGPGHL
ncbi:hypothetical protein ACFONN_19410 [Dyella humi]|uniref:pectin lyase n=1 Tax=Dyella humi TaxID=1770547 RepID=A0ABW8IGZ1_9GAMM